MSALPDTPASLRVAEYRALVLADLRALPAERVALADALGRTLAEPVTARGAAEAAGTETERIEASTVGDLCRLIVERHGALEQVLGRCSLLLNGARTDDAGAALAAGDTVDVLPPFAGG